MNGIILIAAILALTAATSGGKTEKQLNQIVLSIFSQGNFPSIQNAPQPIPPDFTDAEVELNFTITTNVDWHEDFKDETSDEYAKLKNDVEEEVEQAMGANFTVTQLEVVEFNPSPSAGTSVVINANITVATITIVFADVLGANEADFCEEFRDVLENLNGQEISNCTTSLLEQKQSICSFEDLCPPTYNCEWTGDEAECQHPCYTEQLVNPDFCSGDGQVCFIDSTFGNDTLECMCDDKYLDSGGSCVHQNVIIISCSVIGGVLLLALIITAAVLASRIAVKEKREKDAKYFASESGEIADEVVFDNKAYRNDDDGDSGIAAPAKAGIQEEDPIYRGFDDVVVTNTNTSNKNGSVESNRRHVNGGPLGRNDDTRSYTDMKRDKPSVRDYTPLNERETKQERNHYESYNQRGGRERPGYANPDDMYSSQNAYDEPQPRQTNRPTEDDPRGRGHNDNDRKEPVYSPLQKNSVSSNRNRVLREPDIADRRYNRGNQMYDEPQNRRGSRTTQDNNQGYSRGQNGTADRGYDRPTRAPGVPARLYNTDDQDYGRETNYNQMNDDYVPDKRSNRLGVRDTSQDLNQDSYHQNWNLDRDAY